MFARHRRRLSFAAFLLALLAAFTLPLLLSSARPTPRYTVTDLGTLPGGGDSGASAINSAGVVVGYSQANTTTTPQQACLFQSGKVIPLKMLPGAGNSVGRAINSRGDVTGNDMLQGKRHAFLYTGGKVHDLAAVPGFSVSVGTAINDAGEMVGDLYNYTSSPGMKLKRAFLYRQGVLTVLGVLPGASQSNACGINNVGQIVGDSELRIFVPFVYDSIRKRMTALPLPPLAFAGRAYAINDQGLIAGRVYYGAEYHASLWDHTRVMDLGTPSGYSSAEARCINSRGEVAGACSREDSAFRQFLIRNAGRNNAWRRYLDRDNEAAFVYRDGKMQDLNTLIPEGTGWSLEEANGINDKGQIVGQGLHHGVERAFLLTPK